MVLIKTQRDTLLAPLQSVSGIVERRHTLPILSNVLLEKRGDRLTLLATDIEIQITTSAEVAGGEGDGAVGDHIAHLGHGLALKTAGHGARRIDAAVTDLGSAGLDELHDGAVIGDGIGVGHGAHAGKAALGSCAGAALDVLFDLVAGLAKVNVHIHQAGDEVLAGKVADLGSLDGEILADLGDLVAVNQDVNDTVKLDGRVDDVCILKKQGHYRHLQAADTG